jgi:hypothetical protein
VVAEHGLVVFLYIPEVGPVLKPLWHFGKSGISNGF